MRGKLTCGNSDTGSDRAPKTPPTTNAPKRNKIDRACRTAQWATFTVRPPATPPVQVDAGSTFTDMPSSNSMFPTATTACPSASPSPVISAD